MVTEMLQLDLNAWSPPEAVLTGQPANQIADLKSDRRPTRLPAGLALPQKPPALTVPRDDGRRPDYEEAATPSRPEPTKEEPEQAVSPG